MKPFELERYFAQYEFSAKWLLCCSDCEPLSMKELLNMADGEVLELWNKLWLGYTESAGHPLLRREVARLYSNREERDVLIVTPEEGIFIAMNTILKEEGHVITTFPGYQSLYEIIESRGCSVSRWSPDNTGNFNIESLFDLVRNDTKLIVINFPHNPTGRTISKQDLEKIVAFAGERGIHIFSDEMYRMLEYNERDRLPSVADIYEKGVSLSGMSKTFSLPGLRIGWLITGDRQFFKRASEYKDYTTICSSAPSEILALAGLRNHSVIVKRNLEIIEKNLESASEFAGKFSDLFRWKQPDAGPIAFPEINIDGCVDKFCRDIVEESGVMLLPSTVYGYDKKHVRFGLGRKNFPEALKVLEEYLEKSQNQAK